MARREGIAVAQVKKKRSLEELRIEAGEGPPYAARFLRSLRADERAGARQLYETCLRRQRREKERLDRIEAMLYYEREAAENGFARVAGVDEAGRGPLAGPIVAAAVVLDHPVPGLNDSKQLTPEQRNALLAELEEGGHAVGVSIITSADIDRWGIQTANYRAMIQAAQQITPEPDFLLVDGFAIRGCPIPQAKIVKGDSKSQSIAAASIVAKVTRDRLMLDLDHAYPQYGFAAHKGYGTAEHLAAIERHGPCPVHRMSFAPMSRMFETGLLFE